MFGADVVVIESARFIDGEFNDLLRSWGEPNFSEHGAVAAADDEFDGGSNFAEFDAQIGEHLGRDAIALPDEAQQEMLGTNVIVIESLGLFLGQRQYTSGALGKFVKSVGHKGTSGSQ